MTNDEETIVEKLSDEELEEFTPIVIDTIKSLCKFSDKHNYYKNDIIGYFAIRLKIMSEVCNFDNFGGEDQ